MDVIILTKWSPVAQGEQSLSLSVLRQLFCPRGLNSMMGFVSYASLHCLTSFRAAESSFISHLQTPMTVECARALQDNCMHLTWTVQVPCRNPILFQSHCVTGTTQGISHRFRAFVQSLSPTTAVMQGLSLLYPVDAWQCMNTKHITAGSPLEGIPSQTLLDLLSPII